ncbi:MAG TPA: right-handed parallel beta-helix repeat-containing protein [Thermoanaerobaculia bacterium]|nr:right-handed parallel beta-helix repeat-containing protein [Thermoanaerobaculia bacterium]
MKPPLAVLLFSFATAATASVGLYTSKPRLDSIVSRGALIRFSFTPFVNEVDERDVTVDFSAAPATIESIAGRDFNCLVSGSTARCTRALFPKNTVGSIDVDVRMPSSLMGGRVVVVSTITAASGSTYTWSPWVIVPSTFLVTNTNSEGAGSLRDAIAAANAACTDRQPCEIEFQTSGTIAPQTPLPAITAQRLSIDGQKQVILEGNQMPSAGLTVTGSDIITISGFQIQNWGGAGILLNVSPRTSLGATIADNDLHGNLRGLMSLGSAFLYAHDNVISNNQRSGVWIESGYYPAVYENTIDGNGASGVYFGPGCQFGAADENEIRGNRDFGVAISPQSKWIEVRGNSMKGNGQLGIDFALDLVTPNVADDSTRPVPNAPVITSAQYDSTYRKTVIRGHVDLRKPADVGYYSPLVDVYSSAGLDAHGMAQGEQMLNYRADYGNAVKIDSNGDFIYIVDADLTGRYISATYTRFYGLGKGVTSTALQPRPQYYESWQSTSEMSNPVRVP